MKKYLFGKEITPACEYCSVGQVSANGKFVLCPRRGVVELYDSCRKFAYDPLRRKPRQEPILPEYSPEDFTL